MGTSESKENSNEHLAEEQNVTPVQNRRVLKLQDPRSPSEEISRTPMVADTTDFEDPRSPTAEICRTPVEETSDPRSPTEGIPRTPANPFVFPDPRSPSIEITRTPLIKSIEEGEVVVESKEQSAELRRRRTVETGGDGDCSNESINNNTNNAEHNRLNDSSTDQDPPEDLDHNSSAKAEPLAQIDTPQYEVELAKMHLDETPSKEVQEDSHCATLVLTNSESKIKYRGNSAAKRSLKENFQASLTQRSRSPLSSRNALQNSPSLTATGTKHQVAGVARPTRLIGRYGPAGLDKENI